MEDPKPNLSDDLTAWDALAGILLVGAIVTAVMLAWNNPQSISRYSLREAGALLYEGRYTEALALYEKALPFDDTPQTRLYLSYAYLARRDAALSEVQARAAISRARGSLLSAAWAQLGTILAFSGRESDAVQAWTTSVENDPAYKASDLGTRWEGTSNVGPQARSSLWHLSQVAWKRDDTNNATQLLEALLPGNDIYALSARVKLAQFYAATDSARSLAYLSEAESRLETGSRIRPALPDLRVPRLREGLSYGAIERLVSLLRAAHREAEAAREAGADASLIAALWGSSYLQQDEPALALRNLQQALMGRPDSSDVQARLGLALLANGDVASALQSLRTATQLDPNNPLPRHALATIYMSSKEWDLAAVELRTLRRLQPDAITARLEVAEYYKLRGQYPEAEANLREAAQLQRASGSRPGEVDASLALARFYTDVRGQGCERGLPAAQDSLALNPDDPDSLDAVAWSLVLCQNARSAIPLAERAVAQAPEVSRFRYHLAKAYAQVGRITDARAHYTRVMDLDPGGPWERLAQLDSATLPPK